MNPLNFGWGSIVLRRAAGILTGGPSQSISYYFNDFDTFSYVGSGQFGSWTSLGASNTSAIDLANHPGSILLTTAAVIGDIAAIHMPSSLVQGSYNLVQFMVRDLRMLVRPSSVAAQDVRAGFGLSPQANPPLNGVYIESLVADTNWFGVVRVAGVQTRYDLGIARLAATWYMLRIYKINDTVIGFSINNGTAIPSTVALPNTNLSIFAQVIATAGSARSMHVDAVELITTNIIR